MENNTGIRAEDLLEVYIELFEKSLELNKTMLKEINSYRKAFPEYIPE